MFENWGIRRRRPPENTDNLQPPTRFNLQKGMKRDEIYDELHNRTSGETQQEVSEFFQDETESRVVRQIREVEKAFEKEIEYATHEVIDVDAEKKFALISKSEYHNYFGNGIEKGRPWYYLAGINDEGYYFVHKLDGFLPATSRYDEDFHKSIVEQAVKWANREDEGFTDRLQGDILIKFLPYTEGEDKFEVGRRGADRDMFLSGRDTKAYGYSYVHPDHRTSKNESAITIGLGRHTLLVKNKAERIDIASGTYVVIESDEIQIIHPEHQKTVRKIPEGHYAVLANQRGRNSLKPRERFD